MTDLIRPPRLAGPHLVEEARHATWLELFFDLVFVVAISRLAGGLLEDHSWAGIGRFAGIFVLVWWVWIATSYYFDLFDTDDVIHRLGQLTAMGGAVVMAVAIDQGNDVLLSWTLATIHLLLVALFGYAHRHQPATRGLTRTYLIGHTLGTLLFAVSALVGATARPWLWVTAFLLAAGTAGPLAYLLSPDSPPHESHMTERFGLFGIIVLGEAILAVVVGASESAGEVAAAVSISGFIAAGSMWWLYFDGFDPDGIDRFLTGERSAIVRSFVYGYGHVALYGAIASSAIGLEIGTELALHPEPASPATTFLLFPILGIFVAALTVLDIAANRHLPRSVLLARAAFILLTVALWLSESGSTLLITGTIEGVALVGLTAHQIIVTAPHAGRQPPQTLTQSLGGSEVQPGGS